MKTRIKTYCLFSIVWLIQCLTYNVYGQDENAQVKVIARPTENSIKLRWAPNTPSAWHYANIYGYKIERIALNVNGDIQENAIRRVLNNELPIKPASEERWVQWMEEDDYVAVAAQAIYGETFEVDQNISNSITGMINKAKELEYRYSFALFAADQSIKSAELSGLYFEDFEVENNTKYLYRIYANVPSDIVSIDTGFVYIGKADFKPLPKPIGVQVEFEDKKANISWDNSLLKNIYNSYWIERSDDSGISFEKITETPIVNTSRDKSQDNDLLYKSDSLPENDIVYTYRVLGIDAFSEIGPPSDTISGHGRPVFNYSPSITSYSLEGNKQVRLFWSFSELGAAMLDSFSLLRVDSEGGNEKTIIEGIATDVRAVVDPSPLGSNYYIIQAKDKYGRMSRSFPYLVQLEDSIPPSPPIGLIGEIDTLGLVHLKWESSKEADLFGYKVFRSNFKSDEYIDISGTIILSNNYTDTISLESLTEKIYYKIRALDKRFNPSDFSEALQLQKPDMIPPVAPVFTNIKGDSVGIRLSWQPSSSKDVERYVLYRKSNMETQWTLIEAFGLSDSVMTFTDKSVLHYSVNAYTLIAIDDAQLESEPASPLVMKWVDPNPYPKVENVFYSINEEKRSLVLSWQYEANNIDKYLIYKSKNGEALSLFKTVDSDINEISDRLTNSVDQLVYRVVASFKSGERTRMSDGVIVEL